jgi:hypothetical protein
MSIKPIPHQSIPAGRRPRLSNSLHRLAVMGIIPIITAAMGLFPAPSALAKGRASSQTSQSLQQQCADETTQAEYWIRWATETKQDCMASHSQADDRRSCLAQAKKHLADLEKEHAAIYTSQISSLPPSHPVVVNLLKKLRSNAQAAQAVIDTDQEPTRISLVRQEQCLNQR